MNDEAQAWMSWVEGGGGMNKPTGGHSRYVCEFGTTHTQCRCMSPNKTVHRMACPTPEKCREKQKTDD